MPNDTESAMNHTTTLIDTSPGLDEARASALAFVEERVKHPTRSQFGVYQDIYDHFNVTLFNGELPNVILNFSRKGKNTLGFFAPERWGSSDQANNKDAVHELSINP